MEDKNNSRIYPANSLRVCVDSDSAQDFRAKFYSKMNREPISFRDFGEMIVLADKLFDKRGYPQTFQEKRSFRGTPSGAGHYAAPEIFLSDEEILAKQGAHYTFDILVQSRRRAGWQGVLFGAKGVVREYESEMELLKEIAAEMKKHTAMTILYEVHDNLYVNLTNKCPCACTFCLRQTRESMEESGPLWLEHTPTLDEVLAEFEKFDMDKYGEVVFCGFGEPTEALDVLLETARFVKKRYGKPIRINTNGLGNLVNGKDIAPLLEGLIDTVSISLNTPDRKRYYELVRPKFGEQSFDAMLDFARECVKYVPHVVMTTVATTLTADEEEQCRAICEQLGVRYRIRPWEG